MKNSTKALEKNQEEEHAENVITKIKDKRRLKRRNDHLSVCLLLVIAASTMYLSYKISVIGDEQERRTSTITYIEDSRAEQ